MFVDIIKFVCSSAELVHEMRRCSLMGFYSYIGSYQEDVNFTFL